MGALKTLERFVRDEELIVGPFEPTYQVCKALGQLLASHASAHLSALSPRIRSAGRSASCFLGKGTLRSALR